MLMSSSALLATTGVHASTISVTDMDKSIHHETMHAFSDGSGIDDISDKYSDESSNGNDHCGTEDSSSEHRFSPFCSERPYGLVKNEQEWKPRWFNDDDHHFTPFSSSIPPGLEEHGRGWRPLLFKENCTVVPVPAAVWLFGSGLMGLIGVARRKNNGQY